MAVRVRNRREVTRHLKAIERRPSLLGFLLFDERESHRAVQDFASRQFKWLDELATSHQIVLFLFMPSQHRSPKAPPSAHASARRSEIDNPSLEIALQLGLSADDLPGVAFFTELDRDRAGPHQAVYWPLRIDLFDQDQRDAESEILRVFSMVRRAKKQAMAGQQLARTMARTLDTPASSATDPERLLAALQHLIEDEKRRAKITPVLATMRTGVIKLVTFPARLADAVGIAFVLELTKQAVRGSP